MILGYIGVLIVIVIALTSLIYLVINLYGKYKKGNAYNLGVNYADGKTSTKILKHCDLPFITLKCNGKDELFLLDSGANTGVLRTSFFESLPDNIKSNSKEDGLLHTGSGSIQINKVKLDLKHKNRLYKNQMFNVTPIDAFDAIGTKAIGILGSTFFNEFRWILDFDEMVVWTKNK